MTPVPEWRRVLRHAWSIRWIVAAIVLGLTEAVVNIIDPPNSQAWRIGFPVRQQRHDPPALEVAHDRAVAVFLRQAQSSTPTTRRGAADTCARRRTTRSKVSLLTGTSSRLAKLAAGRPPRARPR